MIVATAGHFDHGKTLLVRAKQTGSQHIPLVEAERWQLHCGGTRK